MWFTGYFAGTHGNYTFCSGRTHVVWSSFLVTDLAGSAGITRETLAQPCSCNALTAVAVAIAGLIHTTRAT